MRPLAKTLYAMVVSLLLVTLSASQAGAQTADDFFNDAVLHDLHLAINPADWNELKANFQLNEYYLCHLRWQDVVIENAGIRSRGTGSRNQFKPSLRFDADRYEDKQKFLGLASFVLRNNTQEPSMLRERLAMAFFRRMGVPAPREAHARLFVNDEYVGLYTAVESIDQNFLRTRFGQDKGHLYEYEFDAEDPPYYFEHKGDDVSLYSPKPFKPQTHEKKPDLAPVVAMIRAINLTSDSSFLSEMAKYLDVGAWAAYWAIENFMAELDGFVGNWGMNNYYMYRFENSNRNAIIPWDKSHAFAGDWNHDIFFHLDQNRLTSRALNFQDVRNAYLQGLLASADSASERVEVPIPSELQEGESVTRNWLQAEIVRAYRQVRDAADQDPVKPFSNDDFRQEVRRLLQFARNRPDFVRSAAQQ